MSDTCFVDLVSRGEARLDQIDEFVDLWHENDGNDDLHAFLGMDADEYALWLSEPNALEWIVEARHDRSTLINRVKIHRAKQPVDAMGSLDRWLAGQAAAAYRLSSLA